MEQPVWTPERMDDLSRRVDAGFDRVDREMTEGFARVDREMTAGFERVDREMTAGFERVDREMTAGFERVDRDIRELRTEVRGLRTEMMRFGGGIIVALMAVVVTSFLGG